MQDDAAQERPLVLRQRRPLGELPFHHLRGHAPQGGERLFGVAFGLLRVEPGLIGVGVRRRLGLRARTTRPFSVMGFTVRRGKIVEIDILADPARLGRLDLAVLDA
jgi:hypothetical protein